MVRIVGGSAYFIFQWFVPKLCTVGHCPAPVGHLIAIDEMTRIDQHNLAARHGSLAYPSESITVSTFWLIKENEWRPIKIYFRERHCFLLQTPTANFGVAWSWIFPFLQCKLGGSKDTQGTSIEKTLWKLEWTNSPGAVARSNSEWSLTIAVKATSCLL